MEDFINKAGDIILTMGPPGVAILGLAYAVWKLAVRNMLIQEARIEDQKALSATINTALMQNTLALERVTQRINDLKG